MNAPGFDTLGAAKALREAGFEEARAEAIVITVGRAVSDNVATKTDVAGGNANVAGFRAGVDSRFAGVDSRFSDVRTGMAGLRTYIAEEFKALYRHPW